MEATQSWIREIDHADRQAAGRRLGSRLRHYEYETPVVVGLSLGGVIVGIEIARATRAALDVMFAREISAPCDTVRPVGAATLGNVAFFESRVLEACNLELSGLERMAHPAILEVKRRTRLLRGSGDLPDVHGRIVILADDGSSSREALLAAVWALRGARARRVVVALAIGYPELVNRLREDADEVYCFEPSRAREIAFEPVDNVIVRRALLDHRENSMRSSRSREWRAPVPVAPV